MDKGAGADSHAAAAIAGRDGKPAAKDTEVGPEEIPAGLNKEGD
jgi:hypothetical protein